MLEEGSPWLRFLALLSHKHIMTTDRVRIYVQLEKPLGLLGEKFCSYQHPSRLPGVHLHRLRVSSG